MIGCFSNSRIIRLTPSFHFTSNSFELTFSYSKNFLMRQKNHESLPVTYRYTFGTPKHSIAFTRLQLFLLCGIKHFGIFDYH